MMGEQTAGISSRRNARIAGGLYLLVIAAGLFALLVRDTLIVSGNAAGTAANILASETLFRLGFAADFIAAGAYVGMTFLLYGLLRPVSRDVSLFAALLGLAGSAIMIVNLLNLLGALVFLTSDGQVSAFSTGQLQALALASLKLHGLGYNLSIVVFAAHLAMLGYLILKSAFLPRALGVLLAISALCSTINSFAIFLWPAFANHLYPYILAPSLVAEGGLALWLFVFGVNASRWDARAAAANAEFKGL